MGALLPGLVQQVWHDTAFRRTRGQAHLEVRQHPMAILHQGPGPKCQPGFLAFPFLNSRASGTVLFWWLSLRRHSLWRKSTDGFPGSSSIVAGGSPSLHLKLLRLAAASINVPSTVKSARPTAGCAGQLPTPSRRPMPTQTGARATACGSW